MHLSARRRQRRNIDRRGRVPTHDDWLEHVDQVVLPLAKKLGLKCEDEPYGGEIEFDVPAGRLMYHPWILDGTWFWQTANEHDLCFETTEEALQKLAELAKANGKAKAKPATKK